MQHHKLSSLLNFLLSLRSTQSQSNTVSTVIARHEGPKQSIFFNLYDGLLRFARTDARVFMLFLGSVFCSSLFASIAKIDPNTPIQIQSDIASFEQISRQACHEGNVILTQGSNELHADKLTAKKDPKGNLTVITAIGKPATFTGKVENSPQPIFATAKTIYYYPDKQLIVLEGAATLDHQQDKFRGPVLSYQLDKQMVSAEKQSNERPTITIHPRVSKL
ncbi:MAG: lipopolysaccharide transport periplasmic protein LptA [Gammaproteobacteria bacterium 39-13]|nr:lipopolysaccharide transport periplasmic protein LptA [Gammaproteobacteria bacterium]OJV89848.1 MAG: lipopolysaccharide transport periplasmic protein LptA [Gammaproteobacteria bacterium 39-13]